MIKLKILNLVLIVLMVKRCAVKSIVDESFVALLGFHKTKEWKEVKRCCAKRVDMCNIYRICTE